MNNWKVNDIKTIFIALSKVFDENKDYLIKVDATVGDGDLGITMQKGFRAASDQLKVTEDRDIGLVLYKAGIAIAQSAPSTMGTLVGSGFMKAGKALNDKEEINLTDFANAMRQFVDSIMLRGKAKPGDKTIIDSIQPAVKSLEMASNEGMTLDAALTLAYKAALDGLEETKQMVPQHGKQVAHREKSIGLYDPGAIVGMLIIKTFANYIKTVKKIS